MQDNNIKISIITVCLNSVKTIEQTIQSVIVQDYPNMEYIMIDGGSTDGTLELIGKYENYITHWISEPDAGIYDAMNKGIKMATGDYIAFLNSDDWYEEGIIPFVVQDIVESGCPILCYDIYMHDRGEVIRWHNEFTEDMNNIRIGMIYPHQAIFAKRCLFAKYGNFDLQYKLSADYEWLLRMYDSGAEIKYKNIAVANFRMGGVSSIKHFESRQEARMISLRALGRLKEGNKLGEEEFYKVHNRIIEYYMESELKNMIDTVVLNKNAVENDEIKNILKNVFLEKKYSIFGCGELGKECCTLLKKLECLIECFWDNNQEKWHTFCCGTIVRMPQEIKNRKSKIIVTPEKQTDQIGAQLQHMGLKKNIDYFNYNDMRRKIGMKLENIFYGDVEII